MKQMVMRHRDPRHRPTPAPRERDWRGRFIKTPPPEDPPPTKAYQHIAFTQVEAWRREMAALDYVALYPAQIALPFCSRRFKMLLGPYSLHDTFGIERARWIPRQIFVAYNQRHESAHAKAAWLAFVMDPQYVEASS